MNIMGCEVYAQQKINLFFSNETRFLEALQMKWEQVQDPLGGAKVFPPFLNFFVSRSSGGFKDSFCNANFAAYPETRASVTEQQEFADTLSEKKYLPIIIITHSEAIFNRFRLRIVQGKLSCKDVGFYFMQASGVKKLFVNEYGAMLDWPRDFFPGEEAGILMAATALGKEKRVRLGFETE